MLALADFLESETLETNCMRHLANRTVFSLAKQFEMAETHHSERLMIQVCASIKDAYELDEVVPKNLDSFCNTTKNIVLQRRFELLGIRKPPSPPLPDEPDQVFEHMMNQIIDQVDIQNHHGQILGDQIDLLLEHVFVEKLPISDVTEQVIRNNPLIKELTDELRYARDHEETNFIQAQILVLKHKDIYTTVQDLEHEMDPAARATITTIVPQSLLGLAKLINDHKRSYRSFRVTLGDREIDRIYRDITEIPIGYWQRRHNPDVTEHAGWIQRINVLNDYLSERINERGRIRRPLPDITRHVMNRANFRAINEFVNNVRCYHYSFLRDIQPENDEDGDEDGPDHEVDNQNLQEQEQD
ncbi:hypothetical protein CAEBREN_15894 [Caenorhabditis brenneri]|uniref:Uncharacterized protein n=1 Tax=Caenorhabditis brenneri TaxID=135651 RepID=G0MV19_CAEBE|nr:hypothetical protein CAEBREN_15894 [Caenorhabditis brenneri]